MKIVHPDFPCQVEIKENEIITLVLESPALFTKTLSQWRNQLRGEDEQWVLSKTGEILPFSKAGEIIYNPFDLEINQKKLITALYELVKKEVQDSELLIQWKLLEQQIFQMMEQVTESMEYGIHYNLEVEIKDLLKILNLKFTEDTGTLAEKIIDYVLLVHRILKVDLFILVNIKTYLDTETLNKLAERFLYEKIHILFLEGRDTEEKLEKEKIIVIDKEHCVIYK